MQETKLVGRPDSVTLTDGNIGCVHGKVPLKISNAHIDQKFPSRIDVNQTHIGAGTQTVRANLEHDKTSSQDQQDH